LKGVVSISLFLGVVIYIAKIEECHHERMEPSQSRGHESMRIVEEVGTEVHEVSVSISLLFFTTVHGLN
jgi:hypothetical protein